LSRIQGGTQNSWEVITRKGKKGRSQGKGLRKLLSLKGFPKKKRPEKKKKGDSSVRNPVSGGGYFFRQIRGPRLMGEIRNAKK